MNINQLRSFLEVYRRGSISRAAEALFVSPQAVSKTIASLESELGVTLFSHESNRIIPTPNASLLASYAKSATDTFDLIEHHLFTDQDPLTLLPVACSYDVPGIIGADFFWKFYSSHNNIRVQLKEYPENELTGILDRNQAEFAIASAPADPQEYDIEPLTNTYFSLIIPENHPLASRSEIDLADLKNVRFAVKDMSTQVSVVQYAEFMKADALPALILESTDVNLLLELAEAGCAICMVSSAAAKHLKPEHAVIRPMRKSRFHKTIYLVSRRGTEPGPAARLFRSELLSYYQVPEENS